MQCLAAEAPALTSQEIAPMLNVRSKRFGFIDLNDDGYITRDEVTENHDELDSQFNSLDADSDGKLSEAEYVLSHRETVTP